MKRNRILLILLIMCFGFAPLNETKAQSVDVDVNFSMFQQDLSPYGRWVNNPRFGEVWIYSDANFKPYYTDGHWEYTNYGWSWISDFDWGWAPFHYGRWEYDPFYGWMWIPGYEWASAWVSWSSYDDYYGWAPLGYGVGINVTFGSIPYDRWCFVPRRNICEREVFRYCIPATRNYNFRNAVVINNYYEGREGRFTRGPQRSEVERYTHNRIEERRIDYRERPQRRVIADNDRNGNNRQDRTNNGQRRSDNNRPADVNNNPNADDRQDRTNNGQRRFGNNRPADVNNNQNADNRQDRTNNGQRRFDNSRRERDLNTTPPPTENNFPRRQVERRNNVQQQNNFPARPQQTQRQPDPVREQRNQPSVEPRRNERPQPNYNNGQGRQRENDNKPSQQQDRGERRRRD